MPRPRSLSLALAFALLLATGLIAWWLLGKDASRDGGPSGQEQRAPLGLYTSLPIYWAETADLGEMLEPQGDQHWVREALERGYDLKPLDMLSDESLAGLEFLLIAQPRILAPAENVALDDWVRGGGRLLLFADPLLTEESRFPIGDPRRPQDVVLISPILTRWGLDLRYDPGQEAGLQEVDFHRMGMGVELHGTFAVTQTAAEAPADCIVTDAEVFALCDIGEGRVLAVADAAMLEEDQRHDAQLIELVETAFHGSMRF